MLFFKLAFYLHLLLAPNLARGKLMIVDSLVAKMADNLKAFCVTLVSSDPQLQHQEALVVNLDYSVTDESLKSSLKSCPNLILVTENSEELLKWVQAKTPLITRASRRVSIILTEENTLSAMSLLEAHFKGFLDLVILGSDFAAFIRDPQDEIGVIMVDKWTNGSFANGNFYPQRLNNLHGRSIRATTFDTPPYQFKIKPGQFDGAEFRLASILADSMNFKLHIQAPTDNGWWGIQLENGTFTGLMGDIQNFRTDMAWAGLFYLEERLPYYDIVYPYLYDSVCFMIKKPPPLEKWRSLMDPLSFEVWIFFLGSMVLNFVTIAIYGLSQINPDLDSPVYGVLMAFEILIDVGCPKTEKVKTWNFRLYLALLILASLNVTACYKGSLTSYLSIERLPKPLERARELVENNLAVGSADSQSCNLLAVNPDKDFSDLSKNCIIYGNMERGFEMMDNRQVVGLEGNLQFQYELRKRFTNKFGETSMHIMEQCHRIFIIGFVLPRGSIYKAKFSEKILQLSAGGLIDKSFKDVFDGVAILAKERSASAAEPIRLTMYHLQGAFMLYGMVLSLAIFAFAGEFSTTFCSSRCVRKQR